MNRNTAKEKGDSTQQNVLAETENGDETESIESMLVQI